MKALQFNIILERDEDGYYVASVPSLPGCYTQGKTLEDAKKRIVEVIKLCLKEDSNYTPTPQSFIGVDSVTVLHA